MGTDGTFRKAGWVWTAKGWKRLPKRNTAVKKAAPPKKKRRPLKVQRVRAAEKRHQPLPQKAPQIAVEKGRAVSAPILATDAAKPLAAQPRKTWAGKYDALDSTLTPPKDSQRNPRLP
jgi:hypothetical protein